MRDRRCRPFTLLDAMVLLGATGAGLAVDRIPRWIAFPAFPDPRERGNATMRAFNLFHSIAAVHLAIVPLLAAWTLAFLGIRCRQPRPPLKKCVRELGVMGCCAAVAGMLVDSLRVAVLAVAYSPDPDMTHFYGRGAIRRYAEHCGLMVLGSWACLAMTRGWRRPRCWMERFGRALALLWIAMIALDVAEYIAHAYVKLWARSSP